MNPQNKYFFHFTTISKSTLTTSKLTSYDDVNLDFEVTIDKNKRRTFFVAAEIIKIEIIIRKITRYAHALCGSFYLL